MLEEGVRKAGGERGCDLWGQKADFTFCVTDVVERLESFFATTTTAAADSYNSKYTWKTVRRGWKCVETFPWEEVKCSRLSLERRPIMVLNTRAPGFFFSHIGFFFLLKSTSSRPLFLKKILRHCIFFCRITTSEFMPSMSVVMMMIPSYSPGTIYRFLFEGFLKALHHYFSTHKKMYFPKKQFLRFSIVCIWLLLRSINWWPPSSTLVAIHPDHRQNCALSPWWWWPSAKSFASGSVLFAWQKQRVTADIVLRSCESDNPMICMHFHHVKSGQKFYWSVGFLTNGFSRYT